MSFAVLTFEIKFVCFKIYHRSHTPYFIKLLSAYRITLESIFYLKKKIKIFHYSLKKRRPRIETAFSDHQCVGGDGDSSYLASAETHKRTGAIHKTDFPTWKVKKAVKLWFSSYCVCCFKAPLQQPATKQTLLFFSSSEFLKRYSISLPKACRPDWEGRHCIRWPTCVL